MSASKLFIFISCSIVAATVMAQDPTKPRLRAPAPAPVEEPKVPAANESLGLIPEALEPVRKPKGEVLKDPTEKLNRTTAAESEMSSRVRMRAVITKVRQEPKVAAEWDRAQAAKTDYEKRDALKSYYKLLYDRVLKIDPSLERRVTEVRSKSLHRLAETRIDPTEPIDPSERGGRRD